jgi:hypothetical protein
MVRVCMICNEVFGEKEPLEDRSETHGICDECWPKEHERIKKELAPLTSASSDQDKPDRQE